MVVGTCPSEEAERPGLPLASELSSEPFSSVWLLQLQCRWRVCALAPAMPRLARVWGLRGMGMGELLAAVPEPRRALQLDELPSELQRARVTNCVDGAPESVVLVPWVPCVPLVPLVPGAAWCSPPISRATTGLEPATSRRSNNFCAWADVIDSQAFVQYSHGRMNNDKGEWTDI